MRFNLLLTLLPKLCTLVGDGLSCARQVDAGIMIGNLSYVRKSGQKNNGRGCCDCSIEAAGQGPAVRHFISFIHLHLRIATL